MANVSARVLISADLCRMSQAVGQVTMIRVLISADLCRMSQAVGSNHDDNDDGDDDNDYN